MRSDRLVATGCLSTGLDRGSGGVEAASDSTGFDGNGFLRLLASVASGESPGSDVSDCSELVGFESALAGEVFGGLPLTGICASLKSARKAAGLAFCQWCSCTFSMPDLKVPTLTFIVEWLGLSTMGCGPV